MKNHGTAGLIMSILEIAERRTGPRRDATRASTPVPEWLGRCEPPRNSQAILAQPRSIPGWPGQRPCSKSRVPHGRPFSNSVGGSISQSGRQSLLVVNDLQQLADAGERVLEVSLFIPVNLVIFEGFQE
jgi:hypothetical protein